MTQAKQGDTVRVHYIGKLKDGSIFDDSTPDEPIEFTIGGDEVLADFENTVVGMTIGDKRTVSIPSKDAYGAYDENLIFELGFDQLPEDLEPEVGIDLLITMPDGEEAIMTIVGIEDKVVVLDANHPLADEDLTFDIELVEIL